MEASEVIKSLERLVEEHGDREITILVDGFTVGSAGLVYAASDGEDIIIETEY